MAAQTAAPLVPGRPEIPTGYVLRPQAVYSPNALTPAERRVTVYDQLQPAETLAAYLERTGLAALIRHRPVLLTIDGHRVPRELWRHVRPRPGTLIGIRAVLQGGGGGGGKNPIATIASLAIMVFNPASAILSSAAYSSTLIGSFTVGQAFNAALGLAVNALFPPPRPQIDAAQGRASFASNDSPTYSLQGGSNRARPYEPLPMIAGTHRVSPDLGARSFTEFEGRDQYLYQVFNFGYNTLTLSDFKIGATPLASYASVTTETSTLDGVLTLFPGNVDTISGGSIEPGDPAIQRTSSPNSTAIAIEIVGTSYRIGASGGVEGVDSTLTLEYRAVGSATWLPVVGASASVTARQPDGDRAPIRLTYKISVTEGQYEVRVQGPAATPSDGNTYAITFTWTQLRSYQPDTADYTGQQRVAMKIKATGQLQGQVEQFTAIARAQCLAWNGASWALAETSNPAWWFRAIALGRFVTIDGVSRRVWGAGLAAGRVDDETLKAWATWCDSKSLTFNGVFDRAMSAEEMLNAVATCGRATLTWANGMLGVVYDQAAQPVTAVFGMSNILAGSFSISYQTEQLADEILVNFINPDLDWQRDVVRCLVPGTGTPTRTRTLDLFGCTDLDMAGRAGNLYAAQNAYRCRRYKWRSDFEAMPASRGDVVQLSHDLASYDYSGRLIEGSTASVLALDRSVPLSTPGGYVTLVKPDGTIATYPVAAGSGDSTTLTLVTALAYNPGADASHPPYDYRWLYGSGATPGRLVKIDSIKPLDESTVEITAVDEDPLFYEAESADYEYTVPRPNFGGVSIANLTVTEQGVRAANGYVVRLTVSWDAINDYKGAELFAAVNDGPEVSRGTTAGTALDMFVDDGDVVELRVVATGSLGRLGQLTTLTTTHTTAFASSSPPADVTSFTIDGDRLAWSQVSDVDVVGYRIRFAYGRSSDWGSAAALHQGLITESPWIIPNRPGGDVTFLIVAVDAAGIESATPAAIYVELGAVLTEKVLETIDLDALGYPGTLTGCSVSGGDLVADSATAFWGDDATAFWGEDTATFWATSVYAALTYVATVTPTRAGGGNASMSIDATITGNPYTIEYRRQGPGAFWAAADAATFWGSDSATFWETPPDFATWPGSLTVANEPYDIRISAAAGATQGVVSLLSVVIDVPYITERLNDIVIAATTGTRLPITGTYDGIDNVQITVQADGNGAIGAQVVDKSASGPLVQCVDSNDAIVAGLVDAFIQGYRG